MLRRFYIGGYCGKCWSVFGLGLIFFIVIKFRYNKFNNFILIYIILYIKNIENLCFTLLFLTLFNINIVIHIYTLIYNIHILHFFTLIHHLYSINNLYNLYNKHNLAIYHHFLLYYTTTFVTLDLSFLFVILNFKGITNSYSLLSINLSIFLLASL
jgi:hypothetical protein